MSKFILFVFYIICTLSVHCQTIFHIKISNSTLDTFSYSLNNRTFSSIAPSQSFELVDSVQLDKGFYGPDVGIASLNVIIKNDNLQNLSSTTIPIKVINNSSVRLKITGRLKNNKYEYKVEGLPFEEYQNDLIENIIIKKKAFTLQLSALYKLKNNRLNSREQNDSINKILMFERDEYLLFVERTIHSAKNTYLGYYLFNSEFMNPKNILRIGKQRIIKTFDSLSSKLHKTDAGIVSKDFVQKMKSNTVGSKIQNFQFKTKNLVHHDLYDYFKNAEYGLLIFTAKWCGACIAQIPIVKEIENKMGLKIKVVYVSLDRSVTDWLETLKLGYPGLATLNTEPYNYGRDLLSLFNVNYIPQLFLVDKSYKITYDNLSPYEDDNLDDLKVILGL